MENVCTEIYHVRFLIAQSLGVLRGLLKRAQLVQMRWSRPAQPRSESAQRYHWLHRESARSSRKTRQISTKCNWSIVLFVVFSHRVGQGWTRQCCMVFFWQSASIVPTMASENRRLKNRIGAGSGPPDRVAKSVKIHEDATFS